MSYATVKKRLTALDGLRGIAILLVFLNHIDSLHIVRNTPSFLRPLIETIFSGGTVGVLLLFVLSGFLMAYIYTNPSNYTAFLQKRYTRIFPLFITMSIVMSIFRIFPNLAVVPRVVLIILVPFCSHIIWTQIVQRRLSSDAARRIFLSFAGVQFTTMLFYGFYVMRQTPVQFNQQLATPLRESIIWLSNATLTIPFGTYIPMLDGVYWSLASEVLFYLFYPVLFAPFFQRIERAQKPLKLLFFISTFLFFSSLETLSKHLLGTSMLKFSYFSYFVTGAAVGYLAKTHATRVRKHIEKIPSLQSVFFFAIAVIVVRYFLANTTGPLREFVVVIGAMTTALIIAVIISTQGQISKALGVRPLVFIGGISYSIYLSHTALVDTGHLLHRPQNSYQELLFITTILICTIGVATYLNRMLEAPYFRHRPEQTITPQSLSSNKTSLSRIGWITCTIVIVLLFIAYQSRFNLLSRTYKVTAEALQTPQLGLTIKNVSLRDYPELLITFTSPEDRLGIVTADLTYSYIKNADPTSSALLIFKMKPSDSPNWTSVSTFKPVEVGDSRSHPFGFPLIQQAKGKTYTLSLSLSDRTAPQNITLNITNGSVLTTVHQLSKNDLLRSPVKILSLLQNRALVVIQNNEAQNVALKMAPFIALCLVL